MRKRLIIVLLLIGSLHFYIGVELIPYLTLNHSIKALCICLDLHKIEKKYLKSKSYDLSDFAICLSELPPKHIQLMHTIGWLDYVTEEPQKYLDGFYSDAYGSKPGVTQINHYITIDTYIHLLFIELQLTDMYSDIA